MTDTTAAITLEPIGPGPDYTGKRIWLPQLSMEAFRAGNGLIQGKTFTSCLFEGPAILMPLGGCHFDGCNLGDSQGDPRNLLLSPMAPEKVTGAIPFQDCTFFGCKFVAIGFTGAPAFLDEMIKSLGGIPQ